MLETTHPNFDRANELTSARLAFSPAHQYRCTVPPDRLSLHMDRTLQSRYLLTGHFPIKTDYIQQITHTRLYPITTHFAGPAFVAGHCDLPAFRAVWDVMASVWR